MSGTIIMLILTNKIKDKKENSGKNKREHKAAKMEAKNCWMLKTNFDHKTNIESLQSEMVY